MIIYGVYDMTNLATINNYNITTSIVDTLWGSFLVGIISLVSFYISKKLN